MIQFFDYLGFAGAVLVALAYIPQVTHLLKEHCAYGISIRAWSMWIVAGFLMLPSALISNALIFKTLLIVQIILGILILIFSYFHQGKDGTCPIHKGIF